MAHFLSHNKKYSVVFSPQIKDSGQLKLHHLLCSNLVHFECLINTLTNSKNIKHIDYPISLPDRKSPLRIDIVCDNGRTWIKGETNKLIKLTKIVFMT